MRWCLTLLLPWILGGCVSQFMVMDEKNQSQLVFEEMRQELADVKHSLQSTQLAVQILEEKVQDQKAEAMRNQSGADFQKMSQSMKKMDEIMKTELYKILTSSQKTKYAVMKGRPFKMDSKAATTVIATPVLNGANVQKMTPPSGR